MYLCRTGKEQRRKLATCQALKCWAEAAFPGSGETRGLPAPLRAPRGRTEMRVRGRVVIFRDGGTGYPGEGFPTSLPPLSPAACWRVLLCAGLPAGNAWGAGAVTSVGDFSPPSILPFFTALFFLSEAGGAQGRRAAGQEGSRAVLSAPVRARGGRRRPFPFPESS